MPLYLSLFYMPAFYIFAICLAAVWAECNCFLAELLKHGNNCSSIVGICKNHLGCLLKTQISSPGAQKLGFTMLTWNLDLCRSVLLDKTISDAGGLQTTLVEKPLFQGIAVFCGWCSVPSGQRGLLPPKGSNHQKKKKKVTVTKLVSQPAL